MNTVYDDINDIEKAREKYNKEHKTFLSYGQYVNMLYLETLKKKRDKKKNKRK